MKSKKVIDLIHEINTIGIKVLEMPGFVGDNARTMAHNIVKDLKSCTIPELWQVIEHMRDEAKSVFENQVKELIQTKTRKLNEKGRG